MSKEERGNGGGREMMKEMNQGPASTINPDIIIVRAGA
jgi:hypothetical protein